MGANDFDRLNLRRDKDQTIQIKHLQPEQIVADASTQTIMLTDLRPEQIVILPDKKGGRGRKEVL